MSKRKIIQSTLILAVTLLLSTRVIIHAGCGSIEDLDDRAKCYGEEIEEKQEDYETTSKKLEDVRNKKDSVQGKINTYLKDLTVTQAQIDDLQKEITGIIKELNKINELLTDRKGQLLKKEDIRNKIIRSYAKNYTSTNVFSMIFGKKSDLGTYDYIFSKNVSEENLKLIKMLNSEIDTYEKDKLEAQDIKEELETTQANLLSLKADIDAKKASAEAERKSLEKKENTYKTELENLEDEIANLSSKQQEILNQKSGGNDIVSGYQPAGYKLPEPPFKPAFAAMSYGAYTHRNGMSQYGAKGRAEDGQDYKEILKYYYGASVKEKSDFPDKIEVQGQGEISFQYYLYGLAEMPSDWPMDALKAQAIAGRTYANGAKKPICTTQSCQVFLKSKADNPPSRWKQAVDETKKMVMEGHKTAQYSSTTGGYINNTGWDIDGGSWPANAYEKKAGSPWFYKAWYTKSYADNSDTCGRSTPWLKEEEMADILNSWVVWRKGSSSEKDRISPVTTNCWGGDPFTISEMREKAEKYDEGYSGISSVSVDISSDGYTKTIKFNTNRGSVSIDGGEFLTVFNLRAPGYISIRGSIGNKALYDIEEKH